MKTSQDRVVVIGDALIDELREGEASRDFPGGAALNVALGLSILGVPATLIAMVGNDADGDRIRHVLKKHHVELLATDAPHGTSRAISDRTNGEPRYIFNEAARQRAITFGQRERAAISEAKLIAVSCFPFDNQDQVDSLTSAIADPSNRLAIDPNPRTGMMHDRQAFLRNFTTLAATSLLSKIGDDDAQALTSGDVLAFAEVLLHRGARSVMATAGAEGAWLVQQHATTIHEPITNLPGPVIDTMGAGDASFSAVLAEISRSGLPTDPRLSAAMLRSAMRTAAATCRVEGALLRTPEATAQPTMDLVEISS